MARARKLFPIYGSTLANNMLVAIARGRVVGNFVSGYVDDYERRGILGGQMRDRELDETIGREAVLAMIVEVRRVLPRFFGKTQYSKLKEDEKETIELFFRECIAALGRAWSWQAEDRRQFARDLALYSDFATRPIVPANTRKRGNGKQKIRRQKQQPIRQAIQQEEPPFIGRVALLIDPSMIDQARRAARKFHSDVERLAQKLLRQTLRPAK
jgi:hypothetical protein